MFFAHRKSSVNKGWVIAGDLTAGSTRIFDLFMMAIVSGLYNALVFLGTKPYEKTGVGVCAKNIVNARSWWSSGCLIRNDVLH